MFSQIATEYLTLRQSGKFGKNTDLDIAEFRLNLFVELIGDHPINTYTPTDLQAFIDLMKSWPAKQRDRDSNLTPRQIIAGNQEFHLETLALKTLQEGYVAVVKTVFGSRTTTYDYSNPIAGTKLVYPDSARDSVPTEPLSKKKVDLLLNTGVQLGLLDNAMLPLLDLLTGRRLGLLVHLQASISAKNLKAYRSRRLAASSTATVSGGEFRTRQMPASAFSFSTISSSKSGFRSGRKSKAMSLFSENL